MRPASAGQALPPKRARHAATLDIDPALPWDVPQPRSAAKTGSAAGENSGAAAGSGWAPEQASSSQPYTRTSEPFDRVALAAARMNAGQVMHLSM